MVRMKIPMLTIIQAASVVDFTFVRKNGGIQSWMTGGVEAHRGVNF